MTTIDATVIRRAIDAFCRFAADLGRYDPPGRPNNLVVVANEQVAALRAALSQPVSPVTDADFDIRAYTKDLVEFAASKASIPPMHFDDGTSNPEWLAFKHSLQTAPVAQPVQPAIAQPNQPGLADFENWLNRAPPSGGEVTDAAIGLALRAWHSKFGYSDIEKMRAALEFFAATSAKPASQHLLKLVSEQAEDEALWCKAHTIIERLLQAALRKLHAAIEAHPAIAQPEQIAGDAKDAQTYRWLLNFGKPELWLQCAGMDSYDDVEAAIYKTIASRKATQ